MKSIVRGFGCFVLLFCACFFSHNSSAFAEMHHPEWARVQQTLKCDSTTIEIDAITDVNIPNEACEWMAIAHEWSEDELRQLISIAFPGDENVAAHNIPYRGLSLYDDNEETLAVSMNGVTTVEHAIESSKYPYSIIGNSILAYYLEQFEWSVPELSSLTLDIALSRIQPILDTLCWEIGDPVDIRAWDVSSLSENFNDFHSLYPDAEYITYTEDNELYYIRFPVYHNGIRLFDGNRKTYDTFEIADVGITCMITPAKLISFKAVNCGFDEVQYSSQPQPIIPLNEALEHYQEMRTDMFLTEKQDILVDKILLEYIVQKDDRLDPPSYQCVPAWCFYYQIKRERTPGFYYCVDKINAITGEPILY